MFSHKFEFQGDKLTITINGGFDTIAATKVMEDLQNIKDKQLSKIAFEMSNMNFIASAGLRVIFFAKKMSNDMQVDIIGAKGFILQLLSMSGVGRFVNLVNPESKPAN